MGGYLAMNAMCNSAGEFNTAKHCRCPRNRRDLSVRCITQDASVGSLSPRRGDRLGDIGDERRRAIAPVNPIPSSIADARVIDTTCQFDA